MSLRVANQVSTALEAGGEDDPPRSAVLIDGKPTGTSVAGAVLEAAVECDSRFLLFMTDDTPFEDMLSIHLLSGDGTLLDSATLGGPYATGAFSALTLHEPNRVAFRFIANTAWAIEILPGARFRVPFMSDPIGVTRSPGFSRHFVVYGTPRPESRS